MAEKDQKNKKRARAYHETDLSREEAEEINGETEEAEEAPSGSRAGKIGGFLFGIFFSAWNNKWTVSAIMLPVAVLAALGFGWMEKERVKPPIQSRGMISQESLTEEGLSPFFIPLAVNGNRSMVRVDLTVIWSALAAVKYRKNEMKIRDQMLHHLSSLTRENREFTTGPEGLENDLRGILQTSLGIYNLEVKVREIKYF